MGSGPEHDRNDKDKRATERVAYLVPVPSAIPRLAPIVGVAAALLIIVGLAVAQPPYVAPVVTVLLGAVAAWYFYQRTSTEGIGVELSGDRVRLGRWPGPAVTLNLAEIESAEPSKTPWNGTTPDRDPYYVLPNRDYLTIKATGGKTYRVALDTDPDTGRIRHSAEKVLRHLRTGLPASAEQPPAATTAADPADRLDTSESGSDALLESAKARHDEVLAAYAPYEMDPVTALTYPAISDVSVPETADFFEALADATALRPDDPRVADSVLERYRDAVRRLTQAWRVAERNARQVGTDLLADDDARRLRQATKLLGHAEGAANAAERATYLRGARELIERLIQRGALTAPPRVIEAIENSTALALEAADDQEG